MLGVSKQRIEQIEKEAYKKLFGKLLVYKDQVQGRSKTSSSLPYTTSSYRESQAYVNFTEKFREFTSHYRKTDPTLQAAGKLLDATAHAESVFMEVWGDF